MKLEKFVIPIESLGHSEWITGISISPDETIAATFYRYSRKIAIWQLPEKITKKNTKPRLFTTLETKAKSVLLWNRKGGLVLAAGTGFEDKAVLVWRLETNGTWNKKPPSVLEQDTLSLTSLSMSTLHDGSIVLASSGGEYGDNCAIWRLTPDGKWNGEPPQFIRDFRYWAYASALQPLGNGTILYPVSGYNMEPYISIWHIDSSGTLTNAPTATLHMVKADYEDNVPRTMAVCSTDKGGAVLAVGAGSDQNEYMQADSGYILMWYFNPDGSCISEEPTVIDRISQPVEKICLHPIPGKCILLAAWSKSGDMIIYELDTGGKPRKEITAFHDKTLSVITFYKDKKNKIKMITAAYGKMTFWNIEI